MYIKLLNVDYIRIVYIIIPDISLRYVFHRMSRFCLITLLTTFIYGTFYENKLKECKL